MATAALGFKLHTGWAMLVAVAAGTDEREVLLRRRMELLPTDNSISRFVYHEASEKSLAQAAELVTRAKKAAERIAKVALQGALNELRSHNIKVSICGVLSGSPLSSDNLAAILRSHPLIHAAEGALFQNALLSACDDSGLSVVVTGEKEVWTRAASAWDTSESKLRAEVDAMRKTLGSPWSADHKVATAAALLALKSKTT